MTDGRGEGAGTLAPSAGGGVELLSTDDGAQVRITNPQVYALAKTPVAQTLRAYAVCAAVS